MNGEIIYMGMSIGNWITIIIQVFSLGTFGGAIMTRLKYIEKKQDKYNNVIERMFIAEREICLLKDHVKPKE